jgi:hypothetical protein
MAEDVNNLVLEHLRAIRSDLRDMRDTMAEHGQRLTRMEIGLAGLRLDRLVEQVRRSEHRLDLAD